jgi:hypothetical protein
MNVIRFLALMTLLFLAPTTNGGIQPASADDFCVQLTRSEFDQSRRRRGDANACAGDRWSNPAATARERARNNAINAIQPQCVNRVTLQMASHACTRAGLVVNTAGANFWGMFPPSARPAANKVEYFGHGIGGASSVNLCGAAHDLSIAIVRPVDGTCAGVSNASPPLREFVTARARARCGVICSTP